jgi:hypothetical protein
MPEKSTYYVLDAQGKKQIFPLKTQQQLTLERHLSGTMNVYEHMVQAASGSASYSLAEKHIYGTRRLGIETSEVNMLDLASVSYTITQKQGKKLYKLSNHLGNVLNVITDRKIPASTPGDYTADVVSYSDYSPYGVMLDNRHGGETYTTGSFQGQEGDDEIKVKDKLYNPLNHHFNRGRHSLLKLQGSLKHNLLILCILKKSADRKPQ